MFSSVSACIANFKMYCPAATQHDNLRLYVGDTTEEAVRLTVLTGSMAISHRYHHHEEAVLVTSF